MTGKQSIGQLLTATDWPARGPGISGYVGNPHWITRKTLHFVMNNQYIYFTIHKKAGNRSIDFQRAHFIYRGYGSCRDSSYRLCQLCRTDP